MDAVAGARRYAVDVERPGMLHAAFVRSPHPHARVTAVDASALSGRMRRAAAGGRRRPRRLRLPGRDQRVLADPARHVGDVVAAVAAPTRAAARAAAQLVEVDYEELPGGLRPAGRGRAAARRWCTRRPRRPRATRSRSACGRSRARTSATASGSATATSPTGFADADVVVEEMFRVAGAAHAPMEPHAALAEWDGTAG